MKWRVENSYAQQSGDNGYKVMTDSWFDEYNFQKTNYSVSTVLAK